MRKNYYTQPVEDALVLSEKNLVDTSRHTADELCYIPRHRGGGIPHRPGREAETMAEDLKHLLIETNQEFRELASKHHSLDDRLHELESKHYLRTPSNSKKSVSRNANSKSKTAWN